MQYTTGEMTCQPVIQLSLLHQLRNQMLHLLKLFPGALLVALPAVLGGGHALHGVEGFCEDQGIAVAAGQGNAFYRVRSGVQQLSGLGNAEGSQETLGGHAQVILKQGVEIAAVEFR